MSYFKEFFILFICYNIHYGFSPIYSKSYHKCIGRLNLKKLEKNEKIVLIHVFVLNAVAMYLVFRVVEICSPTFFLYRSYGYKLCPT